MLQRAGKLVGAASAMALLALTPASGQLVNGKWQPPPKSGSGGATTKRQGTEVRRENGNGAGNAGQATNVVPLRVIPAVLMSDGSIMADFGAGMEFVRRACPTAASSMPLRVVASGQTQPVPELQPVPGMQPAPAQTTASQSMLPSAQSRTPSRAAQSSCHLRDQAGRAYATR